MAYRPAGLDPADVNRALAQLASAQCSDDLQRAVDEDPLLSTPFLHAILRQEYLRMRAENSPVLANFTAMYDALFWLLHERAYRKLFEESVGHTEMPLAQTPRVFAPPFFLQLAELLAGCLPKPTRWPLHPIKDREQIRRDLSLALGQEVTLLAYEPSEGSCWSALMVVCGACRHRRLALRAYAVDLVRSPDLAQPLSAGQINNSACPHCGGVTCYPAEVWVQDDPGSGDALAALSCAWKLAPTVLAYQPPPQGREGSRKTTVFWRSALINCCVRSPGFRRGRQRRRARPKCSA